MKSFTAWCHVAFALSVMFSTSYGQTADDLGEGLRAELTAAPGTTAIKWWGKTGRTYFVQTSETLQSASWQYMPMVENGAGGVCTYLLQTSAERMFVRLVHTDQNFTGDVAEADFDSDGLTNAQEVAAGWSTSPFSMDTDGDGWKDAVEQQAGSSGRNVDLTPLTETLYYLDSIRSYDLGGVATSETITAYKNVSTWNRLFTWSYLGDLGPGTWSSGSKPGLEYKPWPHAAIGVDTHWSTTTNYWLNGSRLTGLPRPTWYDGYEYHDLVVSAWQSQRSTETNVDGQRVSNWGRFRLHLSKPLPFEYKEVFWERVKTYDRPWSGASPLTSSVLQKVELTVPAGAETGSWVYLTPTCDANQSISYEPVHMSASWEAKAGVSNVFINYDPSWNRAVGVRIDPDAPQSTPSSGFRRELNLRVSTTQMAGATIYLKVFDVDDPSRINDPQHELDPNDTTSLRRGGDNITAAGSQPRGYFMPSTDKELAVTLDAYGAALLEFSVTPQPGNNYRVAMALNEEDLDMLQVNDQREEGYVSADDGQPRGFAGIVSPLLTVWRKLHIEVDTMEEIIEPKGSPDRVIAVGDHWSGPDNEGRFVLHTSTTLAGGPGFYQGGKVVVGGVEYRIADNGADWIAFGQFEPQPAGLIGQIEVFDDDDIGLTAAPLPRSGVISTGVKNLFKPAYIEIVQRTTGNDNPKLPFELYSALLGTSAPTSLDNKIDTSDDDSAHYWNHSLVIAYQPYDPSRSLLGVPADGDPNNDYPVMGLSEVVPAFGHAFSAVFIESAREPVKNAANIQSAFQINFDDVVSHEIGHMPNGAWFGHPESGLMAEDSPHLPFAPESLRRFRSAGRWQE